MIGSGPQLKTFKSWGSSGAKLEAVGTPISGLARSRGSSCGDSEIGAFKESSSPPLLLSSLASLPFRAFFFALPGPLRLGGLTMHC